MRSLRISACLMSSVLLLCGALALNRPAWAAGFSSVPPMVVARELHTATPLQNGKVLVAGGINLNGEVGSAEIYDPAANSWSAAKALLTPRDSHTATLLGNGKVLVVGGFDAVSTLKSAEIYDPINDTWTSTGDLTTERADHTATLLSNGKVLVAGGQDASNNALNSAELFDPSTGAWVPTGNLTAARFFHAATPLLNGTKVLVAGGVDNSFTALKSCQLYDTATNSWGSAGPLGNARYSFTATLLSNGTVLAAGGADDSSNAVNSAELYSLQANTWSPAGSLVEARSAHTATLLANGKVLSAGGFGTLVDLNGEELYDPGTNTWSVTNSLATARNTHTATLLNNGKVLLAGGANEIDGVLSSSELYDPATASTGSQLFVETAGDGSGSGVPNQTLPAGNALTVFAIARNAAGDFVANVAANWSFQSVNGGVASSDLVPSNDQKSAVFTGHKTGSTQVKAAAGTLIGTSGAITVAPGTPRSVLVETAATGSGTVTPAQLLPIGNTLTVFAIGRDAFGNFTGNIAASWTVVTFSGGVSPTDLVPNSGNQSAVFTGHATGTAQIHAAFGALTSVNSGIITVAVVHNVAIEDTAFNPANITINAGDFVTWTNTGFAVHTATSTAVPPLFDSGNLTPGQQFSFQFTTIGTFPYICTIHGFSGSVTVQAAATQVLVETEANGSGSVLAAQDLTSGELLQVFAVSRDANGVFAANIAASWSLAGATSGGIAAADLSVSADGRSAIFTGKLTGTAQIHASSGSLTSTDSGIITVVPGPAVSAGIETAADGSGSTVPAQIIVSGNSLTVFAISRDAAGNAANVGAEWTLAILSGSVAAADLAPNITKAVFTAHASGTAAIQANITGFTASSGTITVVQPPTVVQVESAPDGSGGIVPEQDLPAGASITAFAIARDSAQAFVANVAASWSLSLATNGVTSSDLVVSANEMSAVFTSHHPGIGIIRAVSAGLTSVDSGMIHTTPGPAAIIVAETAADGGGSAVPAQNVASGDSIPTFAVTRDAFNNYIGNVAASWSLVGKVGAISDSDLTVAPDFMSAAFKGVIANTSARIKAASGTLTSVVTGDLFVVAGTPTQVLVETRPNGSGIVVPTQTLTLGASITVYPILRDAAGNFAGHVGAMWSLPIRTGNIQDTDLVPDLEGLSAVFTANNTGTASIRADNGAGFKLVDSGLITVIGATQIRVETTADGNGTVVGDQPLTSGNSLTVFAIARNVDDKFVQNVAASWSLQVISGGVVPGDLAVANDGMNATLTGKLAGSAKIKAQLSGLTAFSGIITVAPGAAVLLQVETAGDGNGSLVADQNVVAGDSITVFAVQRDAAGNFVGLNAATTWSLLIPTPGIAGSDLVHSADTTNAVFTGHLTGSAQIHAVSGGLTSVDSGTLTVVPGATAQVRVETANDGNGTAVPALTLISGQTLTVFAIARDAGGNFIDNATTSWSLQILSGGVAQGDLAISIDTRSAHFTARLEGTAQIQVSSDPFAGISGAITVVPGQQAVLNVETAGEGLGTVVPAQRVSTGGSLTVFAVSRDAAGNFLPNVAATAAVPISWSLQVISGGVASSDLAVSGDGLSATFTANIGGTARIQADFNGFTGLSGTITANTAPEFSSPPSASPTTANTGQVIMFTAAAMDFNNDPLTFTWTFDEGLPSTGPSVTHSFSTPGSHHAIIMVTDGNGGSVSTDVSVTIAGMAAQVRVETAADGSGTAVPAQALVSGNALTVFAIARDSLGNFVANIASSWSLAGLAGGVAAGDLVASTDGKSAVFTAHLTGSALIHAASGALTPGNSGTITVLTGSAAQVRVETTSNGFGIIVPAQTVAIGASLTVFAVSRDAAGNFIGAVAASWSLVNQSGGVAGTDLVPSADGLSAVFTAHVAGTAQAHAASGALLSVDSGVLRVNPSLPFNAAVPITSFTATPNPVKLNTPALFKASVSNTGDAAKLTGTLDFGDNTAPLVLSGADLLAALKSGKEHSYANEGLFTATLLINASTGITGAALFVAVGDSVAVNGNNGMAVFATVDVPGTVTLSIDVSQIPGAVTAETVFEDVDGNSINFCDTFYCFVKPKSLSEPVDGNLAGLTRADNAQSGLIVQRSGFPPGLYRTTSTAMDANGMPLAKVRKTIAISDLQAGASSNPLPKPKDTSVTLKKLSGKFLFNANGKPDKVTLQGEVLLPVGFNPAIAGGNTLEVGMGNVLDTINVDAKGKPMAKSTRGRITKVKASFPKLVGGTATGVEKAKIALTMSVVNMVGLGFDSEGIDKTVRPDEKGQKSVPRFVQIDLLLDGVAYQALAGVQYKLAATTGTMLGRSGK